MHCPKCAFLQEHATALSQPESAIESRPPPSSDVNLVDKLCPECGYTLTAFDAQCPKCVHRKAHPPKPPRDTQKIRFWFWLCILLSALVAGPVLVVVLRPGKIVFVKSISEHCSQLYIMNPDGTGNRRVTNAQSIDLMPAISPDGRQIVFLRSVAEASSLVVLTLREATVRILDDRGTYTNPAWSPDGRFIACLNTGDSTNVSVSIFPSRGGQARTIPCDSGVASCSYRPDGKQFVCATAKGLALLDPSGATLAPLTDAPDDACPRYRPSADAIGFCRKGAICLLTPRDKKVTTVLEYSEDIDAFSWSPWGDALCFHTVNGMLYTLSLRTKRIKMIGAGRHPCWGR